MTEERRKAILAAIERATERDTKTPATARAALIKEGILTKEGALAPKFGGPLKKAG